MNPETILQVGGLKNRQTNFETINTNYQPESFNYLANQPVEFDPNEVKFVKHEPRRNPSLGFVRVTNRLESHYNDEFFTPTKEPIYNEANIITNK